MTFSPGEVWGQVSCIRLRPFASRAETAQSPSHSLGRDTVSGAFNQAFYEQVVLDFIVMTCSVMERASAADARRVGLRQFNRGQLSYASHSALTRSCVGYAGVAIQQRSTASSMLCADLPLNDCTTEQ